MEENEVNLIKGSDIEPKEVDWLWYPYIPYGKVTIVQGDPGEGKSTFVLALAALLTKGKPLPFTNEETEPINVIYQNTEDDAEDTVIPRFINAGGDINRIFFIDEKDKALSFSDDRIGRAIKKTGARVIIFDPLTSYIGSDISINLANEVRTRFNYLIEVAKETKCAVIIVGHMNKMSGTKAIYRSLGSIDVIGSARSCLVIGTPEEDPETRVMAVQKCNLAEKGMAVSFSVHEGKVTWLEQIEMTADELLGSYVSGGNRITKLEKAKEVLLEMLSEGETPQQDIIATMKEYGISKRTAENAKAELGIKSVKNANVWSWKLP